MISPVCPFCAIDPSRDFLRLADVFVMWNGFSVTPGHALIVLYRRVATWFDASKAGWAESFGAVDEVCAAFRALRGPVYAFNFAVNVGPAGGQTVPHPRLHAIPRRNGDLPDRRGDVRQIIPSKGNSLAVGIVAVGAAPGQGKSGTSTSFTAQDAKTSIANPETRPRKRCVQSLALQGVASPSNTHPSVIRATRLPEPP